MSDAVDHCSECGKMVLYDPIDGLCGPCHKWSNETGGDCTDE